MVFSKISKFFVLFSLVAFGIGFLYIFNKQDSFQKKGISSETLDSQRVIYQDVNALKQKSSFVGEVFTNDKSRPIPTNQWFSSVAFMESSEPIFSYPLATKMNDNGFGISYPDVVSTPDTIFASYHPDVSISFDKKQLSTSIESYDDFSVLLNQKENDTFVSLLRITHGSPFVFGSIASKQTPKITSEHFRVIETGDDYILFTEGEKAFSFFFNPQEFSVTLEDGRGITATALIENALFSLAVLPNREAIGLFHQYAFDPILQTTVTFRNVGKTIESSFDITTKNSGDTLLAFLPDRSVTAKNTMSVGQYSTLGGMMNLYQGKQFHFSQDVRDIPTKLDLANLTQDQKDILVGLVSDDSRSLNVVEGDTYFVGKKLFALANVLDIAKQLKMLEESDLLLKKLKDELELWRKNTESGVEGNRSFYYDPVIKGVVGTPASFGSELFNDHHFHYGYFIYAASIVARYDQDYLTENQSFINLLVQDIANTNRADMNFPYVRGFDWYEGHSWASGQSLFADGNNQESSSEAVNAWYAVYLWSEVTGNAQLKSTAEYLYTREVGSAMQNHLNFDYTEERFRNFNHKFISLVWGGKLDSATWFSGTSEARLAIELLPISPASLYLGVDIKRVEENMFSEPSLSRPTIFRDYLAMYQAFYDVDGARQVVASLQPQDIDSGNSRSFMEAWFLSLEKKSH